MAVNRTKSQDIQLQDQPSEESVQTSMAVKRNTSQDIQLQDPVEDSESVLFSVRPDSLSKSQKSLVEEIQRNDNQQAEDHDKQKGLHVPKWIKIVTFALVILLGSAVAFCAVLAKTTFAAIASRMYANFTSHDLAVDENEPLKRSSVAFVQLVLILCFPQAFTAIRTFFCGIAGKSSKQYPWPQPSSLVVGILIGMVESFALSAFVMLVATGLDPGSVILLHSGILTATALSNIGSDHVKACITVAWSCVKCMCLTSCKRCDGYEPIGLNSDEKGAEANGENKRTTAKEPKPSAKKLKEYCKLVLDSKAMLFLGLVLHVGGLTGSVLFVCMKNSNLTSGIATVACGIVLSAAWCSPVQKFIFSVPVKGRISFTGPNYPGSRKGGFVYALIRLACIPISCTAIVYIRRLVLREAPLDIFLGFSSWGPDDSLAFSGQVLGGVGTYFFSLMSLWSTYQVGAFTIPLLLSTPISVSWYWLSQIDTIQQHTWWFPFQAHFIGFYNYPNGETYGGYHHLILLSVWVGMILILGTNIWKSPKVPVSREQKTLFSPYYDGVFLDSFLLLNRRSGYIIQKEPMKASLPAKSKRTVFICSTMFHEREHEMRQMLQSIRRVAVACRANAGRWAGDDNVQVDENIPEFESHIFFDGAIQGGQLNEYALQLFYLIKNVFNVYELEGMRKIATPYGYQFSFQDKKTIPIPFYVHLKDSTKIKNKKRWSQIMYMKYILNFRLKGLDQNNAFILTTDADIDFTVDSVSALLDFLIRDETVGAVCARTYPKGSGPIAWYQMFEYAFGHWFQKSAEHVLGCVLCCPGCFSAFRVSAIKNVVTHYQTNVNSAVDFLTKDMGEDRWLCTLLIQEEFRLEYAAISSNTTFCPDTFNEFYNQRRRWVPSTIANLIDLISSPSTTTKNDSISYLFIIYQIILIFATAVSPATVILIIASGLHSAFGWNTIAITVLLSLLSVLYGIICLTTPERFQLLVAKVLTFLFALIMATVYVGILATTIESIPGISDYTKLHWLQPTINSNFTNASEARANDRKNAYLASLPNTENPNKLPIPLDAVYLIGYTAIVMVTGLLHPEELYVLIHFVWYLLGLPSGYLLLLIYSTCNLNTRSWGTRVDAAAETKDSVNLTQLWHLLLSRVKDCCSYCLRRPKEKDSEDSHEKKDADVESSDETKEDQEVVTVRHSKMKEDMVEWLKDLKCDQYKDNFAEHGYTRLDFIEGMTIEDLKAIGIKKKGFQQRLEKAVRERPASLLSGHIPSNVADFLNNLHLGEYTDMFHENGYELPADVDNLLYLTEKDLKHMGINKRAHLKQLMAGLKRLKYPTKRDLLLRKVKHDVKVSTTHKLCKEELEFWSNLVGNPPPKDSQWENKRDRGLLKPEAAHLNPDTDVLKKQLEDLRNSMVIALLLINVIWMSMIFSLQLPFLAQWGIQEDAFPVVFLAIYFVILIIQFVALLVHRMETLLHVLARAYMPDVSKNWGLDEFHVVEESDMYY